MENLAHPGDAVSLSRKTSRNNIGPEAHQPLTPTVPSRREGALSRSNSGKNGTSNEKEREKSSRHRDGKASRPASPDAAPPPPPTLEQDAPVSRRDQAQEDYETNYKTRPSRRHHARMESDVEIRAQAPSGDEEGDGYARGNRRKERNGSRKTKGNEAVEEEYNRDLQRKETASTRKDKSYENEGEEYPREHRRKERSGSKKERTNEDDNKDTERSRRKQQQQRGNAEKEEESRYRARKADDAEYEDRRNRKAEDREKESRHRAKENNEDGEYDDRRGRKKEDREREIRARSKSRPREPATAQASMEASGNAGQLGEEFSTNHGHNRSRSRNDPAEYLQSKIDKIAPARDLIKEIIKQSTPIPVNQIVKNTANSGVSSNIYNTSVTHVDIPRAIDVQAGEDNRFGPWNAIRKLSVHAASDFGLMLHFLDWSRRNDSNEPLVAFRLEDGEHGSYEKKSGGFFSKKAGPDWLQESHETGAKVKGRLSLGVGIKGPVLYHIDVKRRKVDKFIITGAQDHAPDFKDDPHYGPHDDYRHVYFETPEGRTMKWFLAEPGKLMRLYGRGEKDYGNLYAEARIQKVDTKKNKGKGKEVQIFFYDPSHPHQPRRMQQDGDDESTAGDGLDFAFICASWWCARQTFDESRLVEAHAEVELIENIEKAFEVDLLAGA